MTPGPLSTSQTVREAMLQDWCTWDKDYNEGIVTPIRKGLLAIAGLDGDEYTSVLLQGSGTYCVEATIGATVRPEDKLLILANGAYGKRMAQIADYYHINYVLVSLHETELVTGEVARRALEEHPGITHLSMVHSETTTGLLNPIEEVAEVIKGRGITFIVDAMSSFAGVEIPSDIQGTSLKPVLENEGKTPADWRKAAYYHYYEYPAEHSVKRHYGIRTQDFKLIHFYNDIDEWEMYDLKADPREMNNVFGKPEYAEKQKELMQLLQETQKQYKDNDPDEKVNELFKGDRRLMKNR